MRFQPISDTFCVLRVVRRCVADVKKPVVPGLVCSTLSRQEIAEVEKRLGVPWIDRDRFLPVLDRRIWISTLGRNDAEAVVSTRSGRIEFDRLFEKRRCL